MTNPENLYIIGNGFDLHHRVRTSYVEFAYFLRDHYEEIYELYTNYFALPDIDLDDPADTKIWMWNEFEVRLSTFMAEQVIEDNWDLADGPKAPDYKQFDALGFSIEMGHLVDKLTKEMPEAFREFILSRELPELRESQVLALKSNSVFLNFNYTNTLEKYYYLSRRRILYIHGQASIPNSPIILGHGVEPKTLHKVKEVPKEPPEGMSEEELDWWRDEQSNKYDLSTDYAEQSLQSYYDESHKPTNEIIAENHTFFQDFIEVRSVYVLGHSIAAVDQPYFREVIDSIKAEEVDWFVSYHGEGEAERHRITLGGLGVPVKRIHLFRLPEMVSKVPGLFD